MALFLTMQTPEIRLKRTKYHSIAHSKYYLHPKIQSLNLKWIFIKKKSHFDKIIRLIYLSFNV